jgi:hypothetical protein
MDRKTEPRVFRPFSLKILLEKSRTDKLSNQWRGQKGKSGMVKLVHDLLRDSLRVFSR